jgi:uncharacterized protein (TIGR02646 family)
MKCIEKSQEPIEFTDWKALANDNWQPTYDDDLSGNTKRCVKDALMEEQGYICCYCERRLSGDDSHIEHFRPQSDPLVDPLEYANMLCSCQNRLKKGAPRHCGNLKGDWFDTDLLISPLDTDCEAQFAFTGDGNIQPVSTTDPAGAETIAQLGLNIPKLKALRASAIEPFLEEVLNEDDMRQFVSGYLQNDHRGWNSEFWTTIRYLFGGYAPA